MADATLILEDGARIRGDSFGTPRSVAGEMVFNTGMVGYPESLTDPSYCGQILVFTHPMVGNYGVPAYENDQFNLPRYFESSKIQASGVVISDLSDRYSHYDSKRSLHKWLESEGVPGVTGVDTRALTKRLREKGTMLGKIICGRGSVDFYDPNRVNVVEKVSAKGVRALGDGKKSLILLDCGVKANIIRSLLTRGVSVMWVPWDYDFLSELRTRSSGLVISNGPGNPKMVGQTIDRVKAAFSTNKPILGICLGNQIMALAAGFSTYKLKYGHRSQNQPVLERDSGRCLITSQNHGYAVDARRLPRNWEVWFENLNDSTVEGVRHRSKPFFAVQFHPEATPGPADSGYLFDRFVKML